MDDVTAACEGDSGGQADPASGASDERNGHANSLRAKAVVQRVDSA